nr:uncharacterized protein CI109_003858 [Kwoniella shandongensis]KAA5527886.1 hypothetical protein CI109_003858 [Kwoniella shandongensis]
MSLVSPPLATSSSYTSTSTTSTKSRPPLNFHHLRPVHKLIFEQLKLIAPHRLLPLSRALYEELLPLVYSRIELDRYTAAKLFVGFLPLCPGGRNDSWRSGLRSKRKRLPSWPNLPPLINGIPRYHPLTPSTEDDDPFDTTEQYQHVASLRDSRKYNALLLTTHLTLRDPQSLSIICGAHIDLITHSPVIHYKNRDNALRRGSDEALHSWPLLNVETLRIGWDLMSYLADSHSPTPKYESVPICCIPFEVKHLEIELGELGDVKEEYLTRAVGELAGEFTLETLTLDTTESHGRRQSRADGDHRPSTVFIPIFDPPFPAQVICVRFGDSSSTEDIAQTLHHYIFEAIRRSGDVELPRLEFYTIEPDRMRREVEELRRNRPKELHGQGVVDERILDIKYHIYALEGDS